MVHATCAVSDCKSSSQINKDLRFHQLPRTKERCKLWVEACRRPDLLERSIESLKHTYICSLHFENGMYGKKSLKKTAIPTLLLPTKDYVHTQTDLMKTKNIPLHDALAVEVQQQDETRVNKALKDVDQSERDLKRYLVDLPKPSASLIIGSDSPADAATAHQSAELQIQQEEKIPQVCPKCYSELPDCFLATQTQHKQVRSIIAKVYHFLEREYEQLKSLHPETDWSPLSRVRQRAAVATGVSEPDVRDILSEEADARAADEDPPRKRPRTDHQSEYDDVNEAEQIEEALHEPDVYVATKPTLEPNSLEDSEEETIIIKEEQDEHINYYTVMEAVSAPEETEDQSSVCIPKPEPPDVPHSLDINYSANSSAVEACRDDIVRRDKQTTISQPAPHVHTRDSMPLQVKQEDITVEEEGIS